MESRQPNVLLINPKFSFDAKLKKQNLFPFGMGYVAACLQQAGYHVDVWDIYIEKINYEGVRKKIRSGFLNEYAHIGITGIVNQYLYVKHLIEDIKQVSNAVVTVGGPLATYSYPILLEHTGVDVCVSGYGEETYIEVVSGKSLEEIKGIAFKDSEQTIEFTPPREPIRDLDALPYPAYDLFNMEFYITHSEMMDILRPLYRGQRIMPMITGRGCPYNCRFCSKSVRRVSSKSVEYIIREMRFFQEKYDVHIFHFIDELMLISKPRMLEFCKKVKALNVMWDAQGRVNLVDQEVLQAMKDAGCQCVGFGVESGSQTILGAMNKQITTAQIKNALTICREINLLTKIQLIYGYPGESNATLAETLNLFKELRYPARRFTVITPLPGSALYEEATSDGFLGDGESDVISEVGFHEWLSRNGGLCNEKLFYNRTAFSDEEFFEKRQYAEKMFLVNFFVSMLLHPVFFMKHRELYKVYLLNWWIKKYKKKLYWVSLLAFGAKHPGMALKKFVAKMQKKKQLIQTH